MSDDRVDVILDMIFIDFAQQNIGPEQNSPVATIRERAVGMKIMNMTELVEALDKGVNGGLFLYRPGGPKGLGYIVLTEAGYKRSRANQRSFRVDVNIEPSINFTVALRDGGFKNHKD